MLFSPIEYDEPLFRPPSEARSLIFQVTHGCSWNKCAFCEMYTSKKFRIKPDDELDREIMDAAELYPSTKKIFLADGNAMVLSTSRLMNILNRIGNGFGSIRRISAYASPKDLESKSTTELNELRRKYRLKQG